MSFIIKPSEPIKDPYVFKFEIGEDAITAAMKIANEYKIDVEVFQLLTTFKVRVERLDSV